MGETAAEVDACLEQEVISPFCCSKRWLPFLQGGRVKTWKRRWFILTDSCLYYFEYTTDKDPIGIIPLENLCVRTPQDAGKPVAGCFPYE